MTDFAAMNSKQLNDWYEQNVGYRPQEDCPQLSDDAVRDLCHGAWRRHTADPHAICRKWAQRLGSAFDISKRGKDCGLFDENEEREYDEDIEILFDVTDDASECAQMALADRGLA